MDTVAPEIPVPLMLSVTWPLNEFAVGAGDGLRDGAVALFSSLQAQAPSVSTKAHAVLRIGKVFEDGPRLRAVI